ncbi:MAG: hypothetical protein JNL83_18525 [Myxococcales bacterium]|nr:hypothetical protein [Myxococcales bacterium]
MRRTATALVVITALSATAVAEDQRSGPVAWGVAGLELGMAADFTLAFTTKVHSSAAATTGLALGVFALGGGMALLSHRADLGATGPVVVHGAVWAAADLFVLGSLIDGRNERDRLKIGPTAVVLGASGLIAGGIFAYRSRTGTADSIWLGAAPGGFLAGGLAIGGILVLASGLDGDKAVSNFAIGGVAGLSIGLGAAIWYTTTQQPSRSSGSSALVPSVGIHDGRTMFSYGGTF